jgi:hypothetical protein
VSVDPTNDDHPIPLSSAIADRFGVALSSLPAVADDSTQLLPTQLVTAGAQVLGADGAGMSFISTHLRVPLGASNADAAAAERLQFTTGEGPCLQALSGRTEIRASQDDIARRWPLFNDELLRRTPYRSIAAVPLRVTPTIEGALDLYYVNASAAFTADLADADAVAGEIAHRLRLALSPTEPSLVTPDATVPAWVYSPSARIRLRTWIATGVLMARFEVAASDALDRLRAYAYSRELDLDEVAGALIEGTLDPDTVGGE